MSGRENSRPWSKPMVRGASTKTPSMDDCWKALLAKREELIKRLYAHRSQMTAGREEDDEAGLAGPALSRELACVSMENDIRTLAQVELSLQRLKTGKYGRCGSCGGKIPVTRLTALPWTHVCVDCAGGGVRQQRRKLEKALASEKSNLGPSKVIEFQKSR